MVSKSEKVTIRINLDGELAQKFKTLQGKLGINSNAEVVRNLITTTYEKYGLSPLTPKFIHINTYVDRHDIYDLEKKKLISIYFKDDGTTWCDIDETQSCQHIDFALESPDVQKALKGHGWTRKQ